MAEASHGGTFEAESASARPRCACGSPAGASAEQTLLSSAAACADDGDSAGGTEAARWRCSVCKFWETGAGVAPTGTTEEGSFGAGTADSACAGVALDV